MNRHISTSTGLVILVLTLFAAGVAIWAYIPREDSTSVGTVSRQQQEPEEVVVDDEAAQQQPTVWQTYTNEDLAFSIRYPSDTYKVGTVINDEFNRVVIFENTHTSNALIEVRIDSVGTGELAVEYGYLGSEIAERLPVGGIQGYKSISPQGYFDAGHSTGPFVAFGAQNSGFRYSIVFYGDTVISTVEQQIISSFTFVD